MADRKNYQVGQSFTVVYKAEEGTDGIYTKTFTEGEEAQVEPDGSLVVKGNIANYNYPVQVVAAWSAGQWLRMCTVEEPKENG